MNDFEQWRFYKVVPNEVFHDWLQGFEIHRNDI